MGVNIFTKKIQTAGNRKEKFFSVISFKKFLIFPICASSENAQCFIGAFLLKLMNYDIGDVG